MVRARTCTGPVWPSRRRRAAMASGVSAGHRRALRIGERVEGAVCWTTTALRLVERAREAERHRVLAHRHEARRGDVAQAGVEVVQQAVARDDPDAEHDALVLGEVAEQLVLIAHRLAAVEEVTRRVVARQYVHRVAGEDVEQVARDGVGQDDARVRVADDADGGGGEPAHDEGGEHGRAAAEEGAEHSGARKRAVNLRARRDMSLRAPSRARRPGRLPRPNPPGTGGGDAVGAGPVVDRAAYAASARLHPEGRAEAAARRRPAPRPPARARPPCRRTRA